MLPRDPSGALALHLEHYHHEGERRVRHNTNVPVTVPWYRVNMLHIVLWIIPGLWPYIWSTILMKVSCASKCQAYKKHKWW
jgi:hypothetical protein